MRLPRDEEHGAPSGHDRYLVLGEQPLLAHQQPGGPGATEELVPRYEDGVFRGEGLRTENGKEFVAFSMQFT